MKKILFLLASLPLMFVSCSSTEETEIPVQPQKEKANVSLYLDFHFTEGSSMSRANADVYNSFYEAKIKNKELTPDDYTISFTESTSGNRYDFKGKWSQKDMITILEGQYKVNGASYATDIKDCSIKFTKDISVSAGMTSLSLTAEYCCFLVFFNKSNFESLSVIKGSKTTALPTWGDYYYAFFINSDKMTFEGTRTNGATFSLNAADGIFKEGKYYFFNDITSSFDIPKMEAGN